MSKIMIAEDDIPLLRALESTLSLAGFTVVSVTQGDEVIPMLTGQLPELLLLDIGLPKVDGRQICKQLRRAGYELPIIMISDKWVAADHRIAGLDLGADDYLPKGFKTAELIAIINARLRRYTPPSIEYSLHDYVIDVSSKTVRQRGEVIKIPLKEVELLVFLIRHRGQTVARDKLLANVWDTRADTRTLDTHIFNLRQRFEANPSSPEHIITVRGRGYRFE